MNSLKKHLISDKDANGKEWNNKEEMILSILEMYTQKDIWTSVSNETKFTTCKEKWKEIKNLYEGLEWCHLLIPGLL